LKDIKITADVFNLIDMDASQIVAAIERAQDPPCVVPCPNQPLLCRQKGQKKMRHRSYPLSAAGEGGSISVAQPG
jgi:hypothetical protein